VNTGVPEGLEGVAQLLQDFVERRHWGQFHDPKNLAMLLSSEAGELLALLRWVANREADGWVSEPQNKARLEEEVGDVGIALLLLCRRCGIDLAAAMRAKVLQNEKKYPAASSAGIPERPFSE